MAEPHHTPWAEVRVRRVKELAPADVLENARRMIREAGYLVAEHGLFRAAGIKWEAAPAAADDPIHHLSTSAQAARAVVDELLRHPQMLESLLTLAKDQKK